VENYLNIFKTRINSPAGAKQSLPYKPCLPEEYVNDKTDVIESDKLNRPTALYLHIPFCDQTCNFCGYYRSIPSHEQQIGAYADALIRQIDDLAIIPRFKNTALEAIYFGGGSPGMVPDKEFIKIFQSIEANLTTNEDTEITIELTLSQATPERIRFFRGLGINRISLGIQTFNQEIRTNAGRLSQVQPIPDQIEQISRSGIENICIDLIYGLPSQGLSELEQDLMMVSKLPVTGCSVYPLIPFPNSKWVKAGQYPLLSIQQAYDFFDLSDSFLTSLPEWKAFSPVQYGHTKKGRARYIAMTGLQGNIIALGPSAGGNIDHYKYLSGFHTEDCLEPTFRFLQNSNWSKISVDLVPFLQLFSLTEGEGLSIKQLDNLGFQIKEVIDHDNLDQLFVTDDNIFHTTKLGRFWAGNLSELLAKHILHLGNS